MKADARMVPFLGLVLLSQLAACAAPDREPPLLPERIHGAALADSMVGEEAAGMIARLHGKGVAPAESRIGFYGSFRPPLTLYVSVYASAEEARGEMVLMAESIGQGSSGFTDHRLEQVEGTDVYSVVGHGQAHYYFADGNRLLWLAVPPGIARPALLDLLAD